jgi:acyl carrier protein
MATETRVADNDLLVLIAGTLGIPPAEVTEASDMTNTRKWDSLRQVMLMTELETSYGIELTDQEMTDAISVAKIRVVLSHHGVS